MGPSIPFVLFSVSSEYAAEFQLSELEEADVFIVVASEVLRLRGEPDVMLDAHSPSGDRVVYFVVGGWMALVPQLLEVVFDEFQGYEAAFVILITLCLSVVGIMDLLDAAVAAH